MSTEIMEWSSRRRRRLAVQLPRQPVVRRRGSEQGGQTHDVDGDGSASGGTLGEEDEGLAIEDLSTCPRVPCQSAFDLATHPLKSNS